jgi:acetyltransferase-like isoleucine patch superfamily enzyme
MCFWSWVQIYAASMLNIEEEKQLNFKTSFIGNDCWMRRNSIILLGNHRNGCTIVVAGSVVTKDFQIIL